LIFGEFCKCFVALRCQAVTKLIFWLPRGNHESGGTWKQGALHEDVEDLQAVVDHLKAQYGYVVDLVVGHSRGSIVAFRWIATSEDGRKVSAYVNASGRYRMEVCPVVFSSANTFLIRFLAPVNSRYASGTNFVYMLPYIGRQRILKGKLG
jgi:alpha/beta superfamily hydrolase